MVNGFTEKLLVSNTLNEMENFEVEIRFEYLFIYLFSKMYSIWYYLQLFFIFFIFLQCNQHAGSHLLSCDKKI